MAVTIKARDVVNFNAIGTDKGPKKDQYLDFVDDAGDTIATLSVPASGESPSFEIPSGTNIQTVYSASLTLTDAQIKTLPTAGVEIVAAPGEDKLLVLVGGFIELDNAAGAYAVHAEASIGIDYEGQTMASNPCVGETQLEATGIKGWILSPNAYPGTVVVFQDGLEARSSARANYVNRAMWVADSFAGHSTDYTGGNAANTLKVTVLYSIADV